MSSIQRTRWGCCFSSPPRPWLDADRAEARPTAYLQPDAAGNGQRVAVLVVQLEVADQHLIYPHGVAGGQGVQLGLRGQHAVTAGAGSRLAGQSQGTRMADPQGGHTDPRHQELPVYLPTSAVEELGCQRDAAGQCRQPARGTKQHVA